MVQDTQYIQDLLNTQHYSFDPFRDIGKHIPLKKAEKKMFPSVCRLSEESLLKFKGICHHK